MYEKDIPFKGVLLFIRRLAEKYPELKVQQEWLEIYLRAEALQSKFNLSLPLRHILKMEGLLIESEMSDRLFAYLLPFVVAHSNDQNIMKICKVMNLAFKKTDLEQEILFSYLLELFIKYDRALSLPQRQDQELKMEREKIFLILNKIPVKVLLAREEELTRQLGEEDSRKEIVGLIVTSLRRRYDQRAADYMEDKWIKKVPHARLEA